MIVRRFFERVRRAMLDRLDLYGVLNDLRRVFFLGLGTMDLRRLFLGRVPNRFFRALLVIVLCRLLALVDVTCARGALRRNVKMFRLTGLIRRVDTGIGRGLVVTIYRRLFYRRLLGLAARFVLYDGDSNDGRLVGRVLVRLDLFGTDSFLGLRARVNDRSYDFLLYGLRREEGFCITAVVDLTKVRRRRVVCLTAIGSDLLIIVLRVLQRRRNVFCLSAAFLNAANLVRLDRGSLCRIFKFVEVGLVVTAAALDVRLRLAIGRLVVCLSIVVIRDVTAVRFYYGFEDGDCVGDRERFLRHVRVGVLLTIFAQG